MSARSAMGPSGEVGALTQLSHGFTRRCHSHRVSRKLLVDSRNEATVAVDEATALITLIPCDQHEMRSRTKPCT